MSDWLHDNFLTVIALVMVMYRWATDKFIKTSSDKNNLDSKQSIHLGRLEERTSHITERVNKVEERQDKLEQKQDKLNDHFNQLEGAINTSIPHYLKNKIDEIRKAENEQK